MKGLTFSDTWMFDTLARVWQQLVCIGQKPSPRSNHAAALIEENMYIFGGVTKGGERLCDLYMFHRPGI